jgi:hypothetical protein
MNMFEPKKKFELVPEGTYDARLMWLIDLGTHEDVYEGVTRYPHQLYFGWELIGTSTEDGRPFMVGRIYNITNGRFGPYIAKTSNLYKMLRVWQKWDDKQASRLSSLGKLIKEGAAASITLAHEPSKKDPDKINVILETIKGCKKDPSSATNPQISYQVGNDIPEALPDWIKTKVKACLENNGGIPEREHNSDSDGGEPPSDVPGGHDDIPF